MIENIPVEQTDFQQQGQQQQKAQDQLPDEIYGLNQQQNKLQNQQQHKNSCSCKMCSKQREIEQFKKQKSKLHLMSNYHQSYHKQSKNQKHKQTKSKGHMQKQLQIEGISKYHVKKPEKLDKDQPKLIKRFPQNNTYLQKLLETRKKNKEQKQSNSNNNNNNSNNNNSNNIDVDTNAEKKNSSRTRTRIDPNRSTNTSLYAGYLDMGLTSTYNSDYSMKQAEKIHYKPTDNLLINKKSMPVSTTYLQSYYSTITPRVDDPMRAFQMAASNGIQFKGESVYHKSYKSQQKTNRPTLPILQFQCLKLPKSIGAYQSTQRDSYRSLDSPESNSPIRHKNTIVNLPAFAHNYDTTYQNMFVSTGKKKTTNIDTTQQYFNKNSKHDINQMGNVYFRNRRHNQHGNTQKSGKIYQ